MHSPELGRKHLSTMSAEDSDLKQTVKPTGVSYFLFASLTRVGTPYTSRNHSSSVKRTPTSSTDPFRYHSLVWPDRAKLITTRSR